MHAIHAAWRAAICYCPPRAEEIFARFGNIIHDTKHWTSEVQVCDGTNRRNMSLEHYKGSSLPVNWGTA